MASKIIVDQLESSGSNITIPTGTGLVVTDGIAATNLSGTIADARLPTIPVAKGGTGLTSLGSAGQAVKVNTAGNALEFGNISSESGKYPFHAYQNSQSSALAVSTTTEFVFNAEWYDPNSKYDTSTGRYTPGETGFYFVNVGFTISDFTGGTDYLYPKFLISGNTSNQYGQGQEGGASSQVRLFSTTSAIVQLTNANDYISWWYYQTAGGNRYGMGSLCYFQGFKIA